MMNTGLQFVFSVASMIQSSTLSFTSEADVVEKNILNDFMKWFCKNKKHVFCEKFWIKTDYD